MESNTTRTAKALFTAESRAWRGGCARRIVHLRVVPGREFGAVGFEPSSKAWLYHSHVQGDQEINDGLIGTIIVTDPREHGPTELHPTSIVSSDVIHDLQRKS